MNEFDIILNRYRTDLRPQSDFVIDRMRVNRLFGLNDLIIENLNSNSVVCEIGSFKGASSTLFAYYCKQVYCVDYFNEEENYEKHFDKNISDFNNIIKIKHTSSNAVKLFEDNYFDLIYIDADHNYDEIKTDITIWKPKIKKGGLLAGHDYQVRCDGVIRAVNELLEKPDKIYEDSSWIKRL
jgi:predicted O-methyltransferase YrrM